MNEVAPDILLIPEKPELKPLCLVSADELADDTPVTPERIEPNAELKPLCLVSVDDVVDDTPVTPERIEPNAELKPLCPVSVDEVADDTPVTPERIEPEAELKPLCLVSVDEVADDTPVTPERIEPKGVPTRNKFNGDLRTSNPRIEVQARYLDASSGSCHDFCKYGHKNLRESTRSFIAKQRKKLVTNSKTSSEHNGETTNQPQLPTKKIDRFAKLSLSPAKSTVMRASSLSTLSAKSDKKFNDVILRKGVGVIHVSPTGGLLNKGKKKESVPPNTPLSPKLLIKRVSTGKSQNVKDLKEVSRLKRRSGVGKGETKQPLNEKIPEEKNLGSDGNEMKSAGKTLCFEKEKGKQNSSGAVATQSSLISHKKSLGLKGDQNAMSKATKKLDRIPIFERVSTKTQKQLPEKKVEFVSWPKRVGKKVGLEEKNDSAHKLAFRRGNVVDVKLNNTAPRRLKFKPRKVVEDLNGKADDMAGSKTEPVKQMTNHKVGINGRLKRVVKVGVEGKNENSAQRLNFKRGKVIDVQPKNTAAPRRLKFKPRKVIVENVNGDNTRRNLKKVFGVDEVKGSNTEHLRVVLKHQDVEGKKDVQSLLNNVIEETATRLVRLRKSKVKALVGAFESLMSLPDSKSSTTSAS